MINLIRFTCGRREFSDDGVPSNDDIEWVE